MGEVFDFDRYKSRKEIRKVSQENVIYEIYLTTVKYVYRYSAVDLTNPVEHLTTDSELRHLFKEDRDRFYYAFSELTKYWGIEIERASAYPQGKEFEVFSTIGDLCVFIEGRTKGL
ncbi:hypothetical protein [Halobacillus seohaensis]|uniref:Uncharacterized protein n=1 Tax=Halobacillus seohaensis TaxID=447421 RepID=A0ABW2EGX9_9BACI